MLTDEDLRRHTEYLSTLLDEVIHDHARDTGIDDGTDNGQRGALAGDPFALARTRDDAEAVEVAAA